MSQFPAIFLQHSISSAVIPEFGRQASSGGVAVRRAMHSAIVRLNFTSSYYAEGRMMRSPPVLLDEPTLIALIFISSGSRQVSDYVHGLLNL
jgi:hypothetical protein